MSASAIIGLVIRGLAILFLLAALISVLQSIAARAQATRITYGVGRQEARRSMQIRFLRAILFAFVGLIFLGVSGLLLQSRNAQADTPTATATSAVAVTTSPTEAATVTPFVQVTATATDILVPSATDVLPAATATSTITPTPVPSALVNSEVGLYLREAPGGVQEVELLPNGTVLILLPGRTTLDGAEWQQVRTPSGLEGWVAVEFITYQ